MLICSILLAVVIVTALQVIITYDNYWNEMPFIIPIYLILGALTALAWFGLSRIISDKSQLLAVGVTYDLLVGAVWLLLPILIFTPNFSWLSWLGLGLAIGGSFLIHLGRFL